NHNGQSFFNCLYISFYICENHFIRLSKCGGIKMKREFAAIGLGRFGASILHELAQEGMQVIAIDQDEDRINEYKDVASYAIKADATDEYTLKDIGITNIDHVIVAIGDDIQASILTTMILSELGIKKITVKAQSHY